MPAIKFNITQQDRARLKEAADFFGEKINEAFYLQIIEDFLTTRRENIVKNATNPDRKKENELHKAMKTAYKQVESQRNKERKDKPVKAISFYEAK